MIQECINSKCTNTFYVEKYRVGLCLQCSVCVNKKTNIDVR